jgi:hypothetical protein
VATKWRNRVVVTVGFAGAVVGVAATWIATSGVPAAGRVPLAVGGGVVGAYALSLLMALIVVRWRVVIATLLGSALGGWVVNRLVAGLGGSVAVKSGATAAAAAAASAAAAARVATALLRVLTRPLEAAEEAEDLAAERTIAAFFEIGNPTTVAEQAVRLFWEKETWIYRRVERIMFLDRTLVRRRISVDFEIPQAVLEVRMAGAKDEDPRVERYLPVSVLRSWPPVLNFDLRDADDKPIPLLSRRTTNALDEEVLRQVAEHARGDAAEHIGDQLHRIVHREERHARNAFTVLRDAVSDHFEHEEHADLDRYVRFLAAAASQSYAPPSRSNASSARRASYAAASGPLGASARANSSRARAVSNGRSRPANSSTARFRWPIASSSPWAIATRPAASSAEASRLGFPQLAASAASWSSVDLAPCSSPRPSWTATRSSRAGPRAGSSSAAPSKHSLASSSASRSSRRPSAIAAAARRASGCHSCSRGAALPPRTGPAAHGLGFAFGPSRRTIPPLLRPLLTPAG